jgi:hypothetical protein
MTGSAASAEDGDYSVFLLDAMLRHTTPVLLLVMDVEAAQHAALQLHADPLQSEVLPPAEASLLSFDAEVVEDFTRSDADGLCVELAASRNWIFLGDVDEMLRSTGGHHLINAATASIANGDLAAVIASVAAPRLKDFWSQAIRFSGFATTLEHDGIQFRRFQLTSVVREASDRDDTGWLVAVRYQLTAPITPDAPVKVDVETSAALELVTTIQVIDHPNKPPAGVVVGLSPDAFTVGQESAAFSTATLAARRFVGRPIGVDEEVAVKRAIYFA